jgi:hypothetical protein
MQSWTQLLSMQPVTQSVMDMQSKSPKQLELSSAQTLHCAHAPHVEQAVTSQGLLGPPEPEELDTAAVVVLDAAGEAPPPPVPAVLDEDTGKPPLVVPGAPPPDVEEAGKPIPPAPVEVTAGDDPPWPPSPPLLLLPLAESKATWLSQARPARVSPARAPTPMAAITLREIPTRRSSDRISALMPPLYPQRGAVQEPLPPLLTSA